MEVGLLFYRDDVVPLKNRRILPAARFCFFAGSGREIKRTFSSKKRKLGKKETKQKIKIQIGW